MRWLLFGVVLGAGAVAALWLTRPRAARSASRPTAQAASAVVSLALIVAGAYAAHGLGIFSLPLVVLAFVPFGVVVRWLLFSTRDSRRSGYRGDGRPGAGPHAGLVLPLMAVIAVAAAVLGVIVGNLVGAN